MCILVNFHIESIMHVGVHKQAFAKMGTSTGGPSTSSKYPMSDHDNQMGGQL